MRNVSLRRWTALAGRRVHCSFAAPASSFRRTRAYGFDPGLRLALAKTTDGGKGGTLRNPRAGCLVFPAVDGLSTDAHQQRIVLGGEPQTRAMGAKSLGYKSRVSRVAALRCFHAAREHAFAKARDLALKPGELFSKRGDVAARPCRNLLDGAKLATQLPARQSRD